jgi:Rab GDP dissociation inhibitor
MGLFEKKRCRDFYMFAEQFNENDKSTWKNMDLENMQMKDVYKRFKLEPNTIDFLGHAVALHIDDKYLTQPAIDTIKKQVLFMESMGKYGDSPFLYPIYGLGGLPESFSRLCAIHGGTYMLNTPVDEILMEEGKAVGVRCGNETARAPIVICDPTYVKDMNKTQVTSKVIRAICIMDHPIANTNDVTSVQIILPQNQTGRKSDIYVTMVSNAHAVCSAGLYIAIVSTTVETDEPEKEIQSAMALLGNVLEVFIQISDVHEPINNPAEDALFITKSYDATSHFETSSKDVLALYEKITGEKLDLNIKPEDEEDDY